MIILPNEFVLKRMPLCFIYETSHSQKMLSQSPKCGRFFLELKEQNLFILFSRFIAPDKGHMAQLRQ